VTVTPGRAYWIEVDYGGGRGGGGTWPGGDGGGASAFRVCQRTAVFCDNFGSAHQSSLIVAAGGGGAAGGNADSSGKGGLAGDAGSSSELGFGTRTTGGAAGTETAGGAPGVGFTTSGVKGVAEQGGDGGGVTAHGGGGGGGGGYYGGGGGGASHPSRPVGGGGGGGGANRVDARSVVSPRVQPATTGDPSVTLTWLDDVKPVPFIGTPANGDTVAPEPRIRGRAGMELGDREQIAIAIFAGSQAPGSKLVQQLTATRDSNGDWSAQASKLAPGTYTALATQSDWANNTGTSTVTFRVEAEHMTPAPTPTPVPTPTQPATEQPAQPAQPTQPASPAKPAQPALAPASIRIETKRARLVRGTLSVRLKCAGPADQRCSGRLTLTAKAGKRTLKLGSAPYTVAAGKTSAVRVKLRPAALRARLPRRVTITAAAATKAASAVSTITIG
jgi:hypothetical protein